MVPTIDRHGLIREEERIGAAAASLAPHFPSRQVPAPFFSGRPLAGLPALNEISAELEQILMLDLNAGPIDRWRVQDLGLLPDPPRALAGAPREEHPEGVAGVQ